MPLPTRQGIFHIVIEKAHHTEYSIYSAKIVHHCFPLICVEQTTFHCDKAHLGLVKRTALARKQWSRWHAVVSELICLHNTNNHSRKHS